MSKMTRSERDARRFAEAIDQLEIGDFIRYLHSPLRIIYTNFIAGIARGLGIIVGMTIVFAFLIWLLAGLVNFPLIGQYFHEIKQLLEAFSQNAILAK